MSRCRPDGEDRRPNPPASGAGLLTERCYQTTRSEDHNESFILHLIPPDRCGVAHFAKGLFHDHARLVARWLQNRFVAALAQILPQAVYGSCRRDHAVPGVGSTLVWAGICAAGVADQFRFSFHCHGTAGADRNRAEEHHCRGLAPGEGFGHSPEGGQTGIVQDEDVRAGRRPPGFASICQRIEQIAVLQRPH